MVKMIYLTAKSLTMESNSKLTDRGSNGISMALTSTMLIAKNSPNLMKKERPSWVALKKLMRT